MISRKINGLTQISLCMLLGLGVAASVEGQEIGFPQMLEQIIVDTPKIYRQELTEIYGKRHYEPLWVSPSDHLNAEGQALIKILSEAEQLGLNPKDYAYYELHWLQRTDQLFSENRPVFHTNVLA